MVGRREQATGDRQVEFATELRIAGCPVADKIGDAHLAGRARWTSWWQALSFLVWGFRARIRTRTPPPSGVGGVGVEGRRVRGRARARNRLGDEAHCTAYATKPRAQVVVERVPEHGGSAVLTTPLMANVLTRIAAGDRIAMDRGS